MQNDVKVYACPINLLIVFTFMCFSTYSIINQCDTYYIGNGSKPDLKLIFRISFVQEFGLHTCVCSPPSLLIASSV